MVAVFLRQGNKIYPRIRLWNPINFPGLGDGAESLRRDTKRTIQAMKISYAAAFTTLAFLVATLFSLLVAAPGFRVASQLPLRQQWFAAAAALWAVNGWLWLLAIFSWMVLLVTFMWRYTPAHRVATMLQSGLMLIAAVLAIGGVVVWMAVLPTALAAEDAGSVVPVVDALALALSGSGLFMGGLVTAWIGVDLLRLEKVTWPWVAGAIIAGILAAPSPFLLPNVYHLLAGALVWCVWGLFLATRPEEPSPFAEWI